jgi:hypothetical protein
VTGFVTRRRHDHDLPIRHTLDPEEGIGLTEIKELIGRHRAIRLDPYRRFLGNTDQI